MSDVALILDNTVFAGMKFNHCLGLRALRRRNRCAAGKTPAVIFPVLFSWFVIAVQADRVVTATVGGTLLNPAPQNDLSVTTTL